MSKFEAGMEAMVDMYIYETTTLLEQLDQILMKTESASSFGEEDINEIFRIMHTIKGSSAMMGLENMSTLAHAIEDMFFIIREEKPVITNTRDLYELVFNASDLLKAEIELLQEDSYSPTDFSGAKQKIFDFVDILKGKAPSGGTAQSAAQPPAAAPQAAASAEQKSSEFTAVRVFFEDDCKMENLRALLIINKIRDDCEKLEYEPADIETNPESAKKIIENGFIIRFKPNGPVENITREIEEALNVKSYEFISAPAQSAPAKEEKAPAASAPAQPQQASPAAEKKAEPAPQKEEGASVEQINNLLA